MTQFLSMAITLMVAGLVGAVLFQDSQAAVWKPTDGLPGIERTSSEMALQDRNGDAGE